MQKLVAHVATRQVGHDAVLSVESLFPLSTDYTQPGFRLPRRPCYPPAPAPTPSLSSSAPMSHAAPAVRAFDALRLPPPLASLDRIRSPRASHTPVAVARTSSSDAFREPRRPLASAVFAGSGTPATERVGVVAFGLVPLGASTPPTSTLPTTSVDDDDVEQARTVDEIFRADPNARRYRVVRPVGAGAYSGVWHCEDAIDNRRSVAVKILKAVANPESVPREMTVLRDLRDSKDPAVDRYVMRLLGDFVLHSQHQCFVFDLAQETLAQTIEQHLGSGMPHSKIRVVMRCILRGLDAFRRMNPPLIHGDLKPENVLRFGADFKISDLGNACRSNRPYAHLFQTEGYRAPEVYLVAPNYGPEMDMWSLGCMMLEMASGNGQSPFRTKDVCEYLHRLRDALGTPSSAFLERSARVDAYYPFDSATPIGYDPERADALTKESLWGRNCDSTERSQMRFVNLVQRMLEYDPYDRITPDQALAHDYFRSD